MCTDSLGLPWTWPRACVMNGPLLGDRCWPGDRVVTWGLDPREAWCLLSAPHLPALRSLRTRG